MKKWPDKIKTIKRTLACMAVCVLLGLAALGSNELVLLSYDLLFLPGLKPRTAPDELVIVHLDDISFRDLKQTGAPNWDRSLHARLLDRLTADQARVVVFDIVFLEPGTPEANASLARAIRNNGKVVLAAALNAEARAQVQVKQAVLPLDIFLDAPAAGWGIAETQAKGSIARQYFLGNETQPSLPWTAARVAGVESARKPGVRQPDTWLNY